MSEHAASGWRETPLSDLIEECNDRVGRGSRPIVLSSTKHYGLVPSDEYFRGRTIYSGDLSNYKRVKRDWFAYATNHLAEGSIGLQSDYAIACVSPIYTVFRCKEQVDPGFLYRILKSPGLVSQYSIHEQASVNRRGAVRFRDFSTIDIKIPCSVSEQKRIAQILDSLDEEIFAIDRVATKLRATYSGLTRQLLDQVNAPILPLGEFLSNPPRNGFSPVEIEPWTGVAVLGLGCLTNDGFVPRQLKNVPAKDPRYTGSWLSDGDILMSRANTLELVGLAGRYKSVGIPCLYPDLMMRLTTNACVLARYLEVVLRSDRVRTQLRKVAQGTSESMAKISASSVMKLQVQIPDPVEQDRILRIADSVTLQIEALQNHKAKCAALKQGLMEDLLTGRVRVTPERGLECAGSG
jgi:type I restriction enzyme S subunit